MLRRCPVCAKKNRIPAAHLADQGRCGSCKAALPPTDEPLEVSGAELDEIVGQARVPVLVDFWASWCGPCQMAAPEVKKAARQVAGKALVLKVDTERNPQVASRFGIRGIPNFMVFKDGQPVMQQAGLVDSAQMERWLAQAGA